MRRTLVLTLLALAAFAWPARAHHSFSMFDGSREITVKGIVKEFQFVNPHAWILVTVTEGPEKGKVWGFETEAPAALVHMGIEKNTIRPGETVTLSGWPMRDGRPAAALTRLRNAANVDLMYRMGDWSR